MLKLLKRPLFWIMAISIGSALCAVGVVLSWIFGLIWVGIEYERIEEEMRTVNPVTLRVVECIASGPQAGSCETLSGGDDYTFFYGNEYAASPQALNFKGEVSLEPENQQQIRVYTPLNVAGIDVLPADCLDCDVEAELFPMDHSYSRGLAWNIRRSELPDESALRVWISPQEARESATITFNYHLCWGNPDEDGSQLSCDDGPRFRNGLYRGNFRPCVDNQCEHIHRMPVLDYPEVGTREIYTNLELGEYQFDTQLLSFVLPPMANSIAVVPYGSPLNLNQSLAEQVNDTDYIINVAVTEVDPKPVYDVYVFWEEEPSGDQNGDLLHWTANLPASPTK